MVIELFAGSVSSSEVAPGTQHFSIAELRNEFLDRVVELELAFLEQQQRRAGGDQLGVGKDAEDMVGAQRGLRFLVGPADAVHVDELAADHDRPGNAGQQVAVDVALHRRLRRFEVVTVGGDFQVFHGRSLVARILAIVVPAKAGTHNHQR